MFKTPDVDIVILISQMTKLRFEGDVTGPELLKRHGLGLESKHTLLKCLPRCSCFYDLLLEAKDAASLPKDEGDSQVLVLPSTLSPHAYTKPRNPELFCQGICPCLTHLADTYKYLLLTSRFHSP